MTLRTAFARAYRGFRDDIKLHLLAIVSLVVAFVCLGAALLGVENLGLLAEQVTGQRQLTVYLRDDAKDDDVAQLRLVLESLRDVDRFEYISQAQAKQLLLERIALTAEADAMPEAAFPASLEVEVAKGTSATRTAELAKRLHGFNAVEDVETYSTWFGQIESLLHAGRSATGLLALLVAICVAAVIGNTIKLAVTHRRAEIEVLRLCGATDRFVRTPFLLEGMFQGLAAGAAALVLLLVSYAALRSEIESVLRPLFNIQTTFLSPTTALAMVLFGGVAGVLGSMLSIRRYMVL